MYDPSQTQAVIAALRNVIKRYGAVTAVDGLSLDVRRGEVLALLALPPLQRGERAWRAGGFFTGVHFAWGSY